MREWFSAKDLQGLPGIPTSDRRIRDNAKRYQWISRQRKGRGGGLEYHYSSLPKETIRAIKRREKPIHRMSSWLCNLFGGRHA